jgi:signal transduction histidine kinase
MTGLESAYGWGNLTRMAVHTAFGFMVLGIGLFMFAWIKERGQEPVLPYWLPVPIAIVVLTFSVSLWQALHHVPTEDAATNLAPLFMLGFGIVLAFALAMTVNRVQKALSHAASIEKARIMLEKRNREIEDLNVTLEKRVKEELATSREKDYMLIQQSRLAAMGEMIGHIAHQWRQPLNLLGLLLVNIKDDFEYDELDKANLDAYTSKAEKLIDKMSATIDDFRNFFHPNKEKEEFSPAKAIEETFKLIEDSFKYENINVTIEEETDLTVLGYPNEYSQVVLNLVNNAGDAIKEKGGKDGSIMINVGRDNSNCVVTITDNGGGIPEEIIEKIFDPYFSSKKEGAGTGLGLYMSKMIIEDNMDGRIEVRNVKGGARFRVLLPVASKPNPS